MPALATFLCECGTRLNILMDQQQQSPERAIIPCPRSSCNVRHIVGGQVLQVFIVEGEGKLVPYDWQAPISSDAKD